MATSPRPIRFGAIGCGGMGTCRLQELAKHPLGVEIVAAVDVNPARLDNLANVLGRDDFKRYTGPEDYRRLIDENDLDAVGVFTPHVPHYDHVKYALEKGVHVLCEKPMVCGAANAIEITRLCEEKKLIGMVHYQRHFELKYIKARELIRKGQPLPDDAVLKLAERPSFLSAKQRDALAKRTPEQPLLTSDWRIGSDRFHLNRRGQYLQALVWYGLLFDKPVANVTFKPGELSQDDADFLKRVAQQAIDRRQRR